MQITVNANHPSLPGHFPGHPIVPGVVLLNSILDAVASQVAPRTIVGLKRVKFLRPLLPGESFSLEIGTPQIGKVTFRCVIGNDVLVDGQVALSDAA